MKEKMNIANAVTLSRIVFAGLVLYSDTFSVQFYIFYLLGAFTDMIDGTIARKLNTRSSFGSKLDSAADFVFVTADTERQQEQQNSGNLVHHRMHRNQSVKHKKA